MTFFVRRRPKKKHTVTLDGFRVLIITQNRHFLGLQKKKVVST